MAWLSSMAEQLPPPSKGDRGMGHVSLDTWDIVTIVAYFAVVMVVGLVVSIVYMNVSRINRIVQLP